MRALFSKHIFYAIPLLALAAPGIGQNENQPYFSLSSARTFGSNARPSISVSSYNVDSLEFRVYRINDAVKFFQQLEDAHQFGGRVERPSRQRTLLERIHGWKRGLRAGIRRELREQFTESPRAHFASFLPRGRTSPVSHGTRYAEAPLLNSEQLVLSFTQPVRAVNRWQSQNVNVDVKEKGVYLVEAVNGDLRAYTILMISDLVSITKTTQDGRVAAFVADRVSGEPVGGVEVYSITRQAATMAAQTNSDGIAEFKPTVVPAHGGEEDLRVVARRGADVAVTSINSYAFARERERLSGYIYTDRPVYRPGHTVHFKGILRLRAAMGYQIPAAQRVSVQIQDPEQKPVYQKTLTTTANGTVQDDLVLNGAAALGAYMIEIHYGEGVASAEFEVEEYKKPEYEVRVMPAKARVLEGDTAHATIEARYYFGEPVPGAKVKYAVYRSRYWFPLWYDADDQMDETPGGDDGDYYGGGNEQVLEQEGQLDADGKLDIAFPTTQSDKRFDYRYRIEAHVTDEARRDISGSGSIIATYGSFLVNVQPNRYFYDPNAEGLFTVRARDYDNKPIETRVHLEMLRWNWRANAAAGAAVVSTDVTTGPDGSATAELKIPAEAGSYRARASAQTPEGRTVEQYTYVWVSGSGESGWYSQKTVQIVPDKKSYRPGDTAKVLIVTGRPNTAVLVSIEGRDLRSERVIRSQGSTAEFDMPVRLEDESAIFVTAAFVRDGELYQNTKRIKVPPLEHELNIKVTTDKPQYKPGESGTYKLEATDNAGKPVARADLSLGVVDEAIYAIRPDRTPGILNFFFGHDYNSVFTENSLTYFFNGEAGKRRMRLAELRRHAKLAQLKPERLVQPKIRKLFPDTAFWAADLTTDAAGRATAKVSFPDSLTTWRATVRGMTVDNKAGSALLKTIVRKNLIMRLAVPRFFVQGDEVVISAIVHNYLPSDKTARISLDIAGLDVLDGKTSDVRIPSRGEAKLDWRVRAQRVRQATITGKALTDEESDALELDLPVNPAGVKLSASRGGSISKGNEASFALTFPPQVEPGSRTLTVHVAPSIVGSLFGALEYLTSFPYGCVEQTMSSFLPNIIVQKTVRELGLKTKLDEAALRDKIDAGLERLNSFQHEDGGWGWWQTDETNPFMTAYVVAGLAQARDSGVGFDQDGMNKGVKWMQQDLATDKNLNADLRAYMDYSLSLAGKPDAALMGQLYEARSKLSSYGTALLGLTMEAAKDRRASDLATALEADAKQDELQAWWPATRDPMLDFSEDITPESTAYAMKFLSHERPNERAASQGGAVADEPPQ